MLVERDALEESLRRLGAQVSSTSGPGVARFEGLTARYVDPAVFYIELKDIFHRRIYDFESAAQTPFVVDCGSHTGMSILYCKQRYPGARVVGFEPDPGIFRILQENLSANGCSDVTLVRAAVAAEDGVLPFISDKDGGRVVASAADGTVEVPTVRLDPYVSEPIEFLKLNIEGAELEVLAAAGAALRNVRQLVVEYHGFESERQYLHELLALLDEAGFRYLVHDFDAETNPASKPPFRLDADSRFFLLVYAKRLA